MIFGDVRNLQILNFKRCMRHGLLLLRDFFSDRLSKNAHTYSQIMYCTVNRIISFYFFSVSATIMRSNIQFYILTKHVAVHMKTTNKNNGQRKNYK